MQNETQFRQGMKIHLRYLLIGLLVVSPAYGQSQADIEALKRLAKQQQEAVVTEATEVETPESVEPTLSEISVPGLDNLKGSNSKFFGYDFFSNQKSISMLNNLPAPDDYVLGPGDEIVITLWGETELVTTHTISRSNTINVPKVGVINLAGKTLHDATLFIKGQMGKAYSTLRGARPRTFIDISLGQLKSINVKFVGEVRVPGIYPVHPFSTVLTGLIQAGGVDTTGSLRNIQVIRKSETIVHLDMYDLLTEGDDTQDIRLHDNDIVFVPVRESDVSVFGEIRRPGVYEMLEGETLAELVSYSGNFTPFARSLAVIKRVKPFSARQNEDQPLDAFYISREEMNSWEIVTGDSVSVPRILPEERTVFVRGRVKNPGKYAYKDGMRLSEVLKLAGGLEDPDFKPSIAMDKGEILRKNPEGDYAVGIKLNLGSLLEGSAEDNIPLENQDVIVIRRAKYFYEAEEVKVSGEVNVPGVYSIAEKGETLASILERAGGFSDRAFPEGLLMMRDSVRVISTDDEIPVRAGDEVIVPRRPGTVEVMGEVYNPGLIHFDKRMSLENYIEYAGGFTDFANTKNVSVIYPSGDVKINGWFGSPKVVEGAIVMIHAKPETVPLNVTEFLRDVASITASLATIIFIISSN